MMHAPRKFAAVSALVLPLLVAALLARYMPAPLPSPGDTRIRVLAEKESVKLETLFDALGYSWPPSAPNAGRVPPIAVESMPDDLNALPVERRKLLFFRILAPLVAAENRTLREQRAFLEQAFRDYPALPESGPPASRVRAIASRFNVAGNLDHPDNRELLLRRVDIVPTALVLAQAANESGWGTSRFAREANNLFGMWTWDSDKGIVPKQRPANARHFVRVFDNLRSAVANYLHTINVGPAYRELRERRAAQRADGNVPTALELAGGLTRYSARGDDYVAEIRGIIEYNGLNLLPPLDIETPEPANNSNLPMPE